jgi:hypothetical protein
MMRLTLFAALAAFVGLATAQVANAESARFVRITKNEPADSRFHLSELEAFIGGTVPNEDGATGRGLTLSSNDVALVPYEPGTTSNLEHGGPSANVLDNQLEGGGSVWSTRGTGAPTTFTADLGSVQDITTLRMWPRNDTCCANRWRNLEIDLLADDGGVPGAVIASALATDPGGNNALEFQFDVAIPEPTSVSLAILAVLGLGSFVTRRRKRNG